MSSVTQNTRLAQVPITLEEKKKIEADFNQTMKEIEFESPILEAITIIRDSKNLEQTAKQVAKKLKTIRDPAKVKKFLQTELENDKAIFTNADSIYAQELKRGCMLQAVATSDGSYASQCATPQTPEEIRTITPQNIKAEEALLRQFK
jgi:hypothetical protein